jgi:Ca2+/Na+ antiporter
MINFLLGIGSLTLAISLFAIGNRLGAIADAIREAGRR